LIRFTWMIEHDNIGIVSISDTHFNRPSGDHYTTTLLKELLTTSFPRKGDIFIHGGDIYHVGIPNDHTEILDILAQTPKERKKVPKLITLGNHDISSNESNFRHSIRTTKNVILLDELEEPYIYRKNGLSVAFVGGMGLSNGQVKPNRRVLTTREEIDKRAKQEIKRLKRVVRSGSADLLIGIFHYPPENPFRNSQSEEYPNPLLNLIEKEEFDYILHGHLHGKNERSTTRGGIPMKNITIYSSNIEQQQDYTFMNLSPQLEEELLAS
jgi:predicted phosphohydrolase